jgi:beta-galactosidase/beta-glucuronidase
MYALLLLSASAVLVAGQSGPWPATPHFFPHTNRRTAVLNGTWSFGFAADPTLDVLAATYADILTPNLTSVPSAFDVAPPAIKGPRQTVFYRSTHACTPGAGAHLRFFAVNFFSRVFADGKELGNHTSPYTPFHFVAPPCGADGTRELALMVNNVFNKTLCPTCTGGDFYAYGGIIRPVVVTELPTARPYYIERVEPLTTDVAGGLITVRVAFGGAPPASASLTLAFNGGAPGPATNAPVVGGVATLAGVAVPNAQPWRLGEGNLFTLTVAEAASGDAFTTRSGLRALGVAPGAPGSAARLTINGEVVKLKGFNRHHIWPDTGAAVTPEQEAVDLALIKELNVNYIRVSSAP